MELTTLAGAPKAGRAIIAKKSTMFAPANGPAGITEAAKMRYQRATVQWTLNVAVLPVSWGKLVKKSTRARTTAAVGMVNVSSSMKSPSVFVSKELPESAVKLCRSALLSLA